MAGLDRDFLSMLETAVLWERNIGEDLFGNDAYNPGVSVAAYVSSFSNEYGAQDGQGSKDDEKIIRAEVFTNWVGMAVKDRVTVNGTALYVQSVSTGHDELGNPLYHEVSAASIKRG